jgi:hypothetical protein
MQTVITHPDGVAAGVAAPTAREQISVGVAEVEAVVTRSRSLSGLERLAIYGGAYYARLLDCLREEFPVLIHAVGEDVFDAFAFGYLQNYPSRSYTLNCLAADFARYLAETRPGDGEHDAAFAGWLDFLIELATLEWTIGEVFDGPGEEGEPPLAVARLRAIPAARWPAARLVPARSLRLLRLHYPAHQYYAAVRRGDEATPPAPAETYLAVSRRQYVVRHRPLEGPEYEVLRAVTSGQTIEDALRVAADAEGASSDELAAALVEWFRVWAAEGFFRDVQLEP